MKEKKYDAEVEEFQARLVNGLPPPLKVFFALRDLVFIYSLKMNNRRDCNLWILVFCAQQERRAIGRTVTGALKDPSQGVMVMEVSGSCTFSLIVGLCLSFCILHIQSNTFFFLIIYFPGRDRKD